MMAAVSALYGTAGQAGGSGFVAVMTLAAFPLDQIRPTAFALNIVAAAYASVQMHRAKLVDWSLFGNLVVASVPAALLGGLVVLRGPVYSGVTGALLLVAAILMAARMSGHEPRPLPRASAFFAGAVTGFASGITGVGGGVFLSSVLILFGKVSPRTTAALSPPFIVVNSLASLLGLLLAGQRVPLAAAPFAAAAVVGSAIGTAIGLRWMSAHAIRLVLAGILLVAAGLMLARTLSALGHA